MLGHTAPRVPRNTFGEWQQISRTTFQGGIFLKGVCFSLQGGGFYKNGK